MWKEVVIVQFQALSWHLPATTKENQDKPQQESWSPGWSSNLESLQYLKGQLTTWRKKLRAIWEAS